MPVRPYRVVQWATGTIGARSLRAILEHPALTLAGVHVRTPVKIGRDAGELCGHGTTGVITTGDLDEIVALAADCVLYMPITADLDELCRLLASGTNVVTTCGGFQCPDTMSRSIRERVEAACAEGGSSLHGTGSSPGFITEVVPLVLTSVQRQLMNLTIDEYADLSQRDSPEMLFDVMGFGRRPALFDERRLNRARTSFGPSLRLVADALGLPLDDIDASGELAIARRDVRVAAGPLTGGTVAAQRITASGMRNGRPLLRFRATWYCTTDLEPAWEVRGTGWHISVDGDAPMDVDIRLPIPLTRMAEVSPGYTANRAVNAVPYVCSAAPGIQSTVDLPQIVAALR